MHTFNATATINGTEHSFQFTAENTAAGFSGTITAGDLVIPFTAVNGLAKGSYDATATYGGITVPFTFSAVPNSPLGTGFTGVMLTSAFSVSFGAIIAPTVDPPPQGPAPSNVVATAWPYTTLVSFTPAVAPAGKMIVGYTASGVNASWITGSAPTGPICARQDSAVGNQFTVVANYSDGTTSAASAPSNTVSSTQPPNTPSTLPDVYADGVFYWQGDYDYGVETYYAALAPDGTTAIEVSSQGGGWLPYAPDNTFDATPYKYVNLTLMATTPNKQWQLLFYQVGDVAIGNPLPIPSTAPANQWATYKIPLASLGVGAGLVTSIYKFGLSDPYVNGAPQPQNDYYVGDVHFSAT